MTTNEAAERLRGYRRKDAALVLVRPMPGVGGEEAVIPGWAADAIEAAERRATVERIQSNVRLVLLRHHVSDEDIATCDVCTALRRAILDEEAAR